ncbi:MAG: RT0821/Lpp0805 family surface protein [Proteobacteria bacterium]|nr:RT0821/Lpp0805 family surface protein [Pseudomonadota bacterium]
MKRFSVLVLIAGLTACQTNDPANQRASATLSGLFLGAFVGYNILSSGGNGQTIMTILGAAAGSAGGYYAADYIIRMDREKMERAAFLSLDGAAEGSTVYWENEDTGSAGSFWVLRSFQEPDGRLCREFIANVMGDSATIERQNKACRIRNGAWEIG